MKRLTQEQWREYNNVRNCSISTRPFKVADKNVLDHDHLTGKYRSSAHNACNLNYGINPKKMKILCIVHNLKDIFSMLQLFSLLLVFETHFDSYFMILILIAIFYLHQFLQVKVVSVILQVFSVKLLYMLLYCLQYMMPTSHYQLLNHIMEKLQSSPTTWSTTRPLQSTTSCSQTRVNLCCPPLTNCPPA